MSVPQLEWVTASCIFRSGRRSDFLTDYKGPRDIVFVSGWLQRVTSRTRTGNYSEQDRIRTKINITRGLPDESIGIAPDTGRKIGLLSLVLTGIRPPFF